MSHDVQQVRSFEHPGEGRRRAKSTPKGRQVDPTAGLEIERLLGDRLEVHCTDPLAAIDIPNLIRETGDQVEITERAERRIVFQIEKASGLADLPS